MTSIELTDDLRKDINSRTLTRMERCHTMFDNKRLSVAEHTFMCQIYLMNHYAELKLLFGDIASLPEMIQFMLVHDLDEAVTGDIPSPYKSMVERNLTKEGKDSITEWVDREFHEHYRPSKLLSAGVCAYDALMSGASYAETKAAIRTIDVYEFVMHRLTEKMMGNDLMDSKLAAGVHYLLELIVNSKYFQEQREFSDFEELLKTDFANRLNMTRNIFNLAKQLSAGGFAGIIMEPVEKYDNEENGEW